MGAQRRTIIGSIPKDAKGKGLVKAIGAMNEIKQVDKKKKK